MARFKGGKRYRALRTKVSKSLTAFACATPAEQKACEHFAETRTTAHVRISSPVPKRYPETPDDYSESVNVMYDTLRT